MILAVALLAAVGLVGWWVFPEDSPERAAVEPEAYAYATTGFEEVDILAGARHTYPETTGVAVLLARRGRHSSQYPQPEGRTATPVVSG